MESPCRNFSQLKLKIKRIVGNMQLLSNCDGNESNLENFKTETEYLLNKLENLPLEHFKSKMKRRRRKAYKSLLSERNKNDGQEQNDADDESTKFTVLREPKQKFDCHFRIIKECKRFLQTFELLERLHILRGHNSSETYKFALKLRQLKSIWNCLLQDKLQEQTSADVTIQQQWNIVLFGPPEKTFFHDNPDLHNFIRKRKVWDTYIDNKYGSSIPVGWIIPHAEIKQAWQPYLSPNI